MDGHRYVVGIDSSTQGTAALVLDRGDFRVVAEARVRYRDDPRLQGFGLMEGSPLLPPREEGEADQPAALYLAALDALLSDLPREILAELAAVNCSAQQHGQVWLGAGAEAAFAGLGQPGAGPAGARVGTGLADRLAAAFATPRAPIWMSSNTAVEAAALRAEAGGRDPMTALSGSDSPLRFSGAVLRHRALAEPGSYAAATRIHLISSFLSGVLAGRVDAPMDWGNGSGTSLMDWQSRSLSPRLLAAAARGLPGGAEALAARLPALVHPLSPVGRIAPYFTDRYGIPADCLVVAGSGDNPQSKVLASGSLLSLGTSFVLMAEGRRPHPAANAMYDGLGRPFLFGCRTNGALCWESVRSSHGLGADDFTASEAALDAVPVGGILRVSQRERESFPASPPVDIGRRGTFAEDYSGVVDSTLGLVWLGSRDFASEVGELFTTGGAAASPATLRRIAAIWNRPVVAMEEAGAAAGAAVAAVAALLPGEEGLARAAEAAAAVSRRRPPIRADREAIHSCHGEGGYLARLGRLLETGF